MKVIFLLLIGAALGIVGWRYYERTENPTLGQRVDNLADKTREAVVEAKDTVASKAQNANLTPETIKDELAKTGQVVRSKAKTVGERIDDARIVAVIKGKYVVEKNLSAFAIDIDCRDGQVQLKGSVNSPDLIGRAVVLALETSGVHNVISQLVVRN